MSNYARRPARILAGVLAGALALSVTPILGFSGTAGALEPATGDGSVCEDVTPATEPFTDVQSNDVAINEIICLVATGITKGVTATTYEPTSPVTRRQMALFLVRLADEIAEHAVPGQVTPLPAGDGTTPFTDIGGESAEAKVAIDRLNQAGIAQGVTATTFVPGDAVTRRQMAKFLVRLQEFMAGADVTPDNAPNAFTDDNGDSGEAELNVLAAEGVFVGNAAPNAGTVSPGANISRRQMALVIIRKAQYLFEEGVITRLFPEDDGTTGTVTSDGADPVLFDDPSGKALSANLGADTDTGDTFFIDGNPATEAAFIAATSRGDTIVLTDSDGDGDFDIHRLTNNPLPSSGVIGFVDTVGDDFAFITAGGSKLTTVFYGDPTDTYTVDGAAVSLAGFEAALSMGDSVVTTDTSNPADGDPDTFALTNGSWNGPVSDIVVTAGVSVSFFARGSGDEPDNAVDADPFIVRAVEVTGGTQVLTIGGAPATYAQFEAALSDGDTVVYSRAAGVERFALTNVAPSAVSGTATDDIDTATDVIVLAIGATDVPVDYSCASSYRVNGVAVTEPEFEAALTAGDTINFTPNNPDTPANECAIALTNAALQGGIRDVDVPNTTYDVVNAQNNVLYDDLDYTAAVFGGTDRYFVNGSEVNLATFNQYLTKVAADATPDDTIQVVDNGVLSTDHRLTTDETLP